MTRRGAPFRQVDVARALKGAASAGLAVDSYTVDADGKIVVKLKRDAPVPAVDEFDAWRAKRASQAPRS